MNPWFILGSKQGILTGREGSVQLTSLGPRMRSHPNQNVNCTEPSPSVRVWHWLIIGSKQGILVEMKEHYA